MPMEQDRTGSALQASLDQLLAGIVHDAEFYGLRAASVEPARIALDVGANRGQSIVSLKILFPDVVIHAFEPNPVFHECLAQLAGHFGDSVLLHPCGLDPGEGEVPLYVPFVGDAPYPEAVTTRPDQFGKPWVAEKFEARGKMRVAPSMTDVRSGDDLDLRPDIIKIDVEGAELGVLKGLRNTIIRSHPALLVETRDWDGVTAFLADLGYAPFRWEPDQGRLVPYHGESAITLYLHRSRHLLALPVSAGTSGCKSDSPARDAPQNYPLASGSADPALAAKRTRILVANFFPAFRPPRSGGEQRYYYFYHHLSRHYEITLLSPTHSNQTFEEVRHSPTFRELRVPKDPAFDRLHWELDKAGIGPECSAYVVSLASALETEYGRRFAVETLEADLIIHESPFTLAYDRSFGIDGRPRIYNAYNVEHRLAQQILRGRVGAKASDFIRFLERALATRAALIFATSEEDRKQLSADFDVPLERIALAPNGFEPCLDETASGPDVRERDAPRVVFIGSAHPPNVEAARFIIEHLAPALRDVEFRVVGAVCSKLAERLPENVRLLGILDEAAKRRELERCAAAINPMFSGSGTNLKMLDYLGSGAPAVTTQIGARGLPLVDGVTAFIADGAEFSIRLQRVLADAALRRSVGSAGRELAHSGFTWRLIADSAHAAIQTAIASRNTGGVGSGSRPLLLVINDFPVSPATGGGEVRILELLIELGRQFDVVLLCLTREARHTERGLATHVREIRIPKTPQHRDAEIHAARDGVVSINDVLAAEFCNANVDLVAAIRRFASSAAAVIFEHPYLAPVMEFLPVGKPVVYSALNVERRLKADLLRERRDYAHRLHQVDQLERRMLERADVVVCVSDSDRDDFRETVPDRRYVVIENGARTGSRESYGVRRAYPPGHCDRRMLGVFVGSSHAPNVEAARFLIQVVAPAISTLDIALIGSVCAGVALSALPPNVHLLGVLTELEKNALLARADLALNPLEAGGGSSMKVPDFFASGLPLVSTRTGVRGYRLRDGEHYLESDRNHFVERVRHLVENAELRERLGRSARRYAEDVLDWTILGRRYRSAMAGLIGSAHRPRVLVVTYRLADPPPGGAETYMVNVLREFARSGRLDIDVATCDIGTIVDKWHFSADYKRRERDIRATSLVAAVHRFPVDPPDAANFARCARLFEVWMAETREQALACAFDVEVRALLGGWNFPERHGASVIRWTSRESQFQVGRPANTIRIVGHAPHATRVEIRCGSRSIGSRTLNGRFEWTMEIETGSSILSVRTERPFRPEGDPRELGLLIEEVAVHDGNHWESMRLDEDFETILRRLNGPQWVRSLIDTTHRRRQADDELFFATRGPHSSDLSRWMDSNVADYDVVLAQGMPFSTPVVAARAAVRRGVPLVLLPHFHMEDRYYHWRHYYEAFLSAQRVIVGPASAKSVFFDAIGAASVSIPGGGVDLEEFASERLRGAEPAFEAVHASSMPFVLVLGRKTGAKNYQTVVEAVAQVNRAEHRIDLVLIGPDEDGIAVATSHVYCYGPQCRSVVLGALKRSLCLVNMSASESFGIVLLESWLAGRPVIAQRHCMAFADVVGSGLNGMLAETIAEVAAAIERYLEDAPLATAHARHGRAVAEQYSWGRIAQQIEATLIDAARPTDAREEERRHA